MPIKTKNTAPTDAIRRFVIGPIQLPGQHTADVAKIAAFDMPDDAYITALDVWARDSGGSSETCAVNVITGGSTIVTANIIADSVITTTPDAPGTSVSAGDEILISLDLGGSSPEFDDISVTIHCRSR